MNRKHIQINTKNIKFSYRFDSKAPAALDNNHCHESYEILFVTSGEGRYIVEGSSFDIRPGNLLIVCPYEYHCVELNENEAYERYVFHFSSSVLNDDVAALLNSLTKSEGISGRFYSSAQLSPEVYSLFERYVGIHTFPEEEREIYSKLLLSELLVLLSLADGMQMSHTGEDLGARVIRYLNENIDKDVSLEKLSKRFYVSKYYLCRAFKKHNGISIHGYINQKRVMYAKRLIESGETASGAAYRVGFGDYSAFYRAYVKLIGKAPTED